MQEKWNDLPQVIIRDKASLGHKFCTIFQKSSIPCFLGPLPNFLSVFRKRKPKVSSNMVWCFITYGKRKIGIEFLLFWKPKGKSHCFIIFIVSRLSYHLGKKESLFGDSCMSIVIYTLMRCAIYEIVIYATEARSSFYYLKLF